MRKILRMLIILGVPGTALLHFPRDTGLRLIGEGCMVGAIGQIARRCLLMACLMLGSAGALAQSTSGDHARTDRCGYKSYEKAIESTRLLVLSESRFRVPAGFLGPNRTYGCVMLAFEIDRDGEARNIEVVKYSPTRILVESARRSLSEYRFKSDDTSSGRKVIFFEIDAYQGLLTSPEMSKSDQKQ